MSMTETTAEMCCFLVCSLSTKGRCVGEVVKTEATTSKRKNQQQLGSDDFEWARHPTTTWTARLKHNHEGEWGARDEEAVDVSGAGQCRFTQVGEAKAVENTGKGWLGRHQAGWSSIYCQNHWSEPAARRTKRGGRHGANRASGSNQKQC